MGSRHEAAHGSATPAVRMDKWLWAARFFKTRGLAAKACELGRVVSNGVIAKAARDVHSGDRLRVTTEAGEFEMEVLSLSEVRGGAAVAQTLYREFEESALRRQQLAAERRLTRQFEAVPEARPSKRDRRQLSRLRGRN